MGYLQAAFLSGVFLYLLLLIGSVVHFGEDVVALAAASIMENDGCKKSAVLVDPDEGGHNDGG